MERSKVQLKMSTSRHSQTDEVSEIMNRMMGKYVICNCSHHEDD